MGKVTMKIKKLAVRIGTRNDHAKILAGLLITFMKNSEDETQQFQQLVQSIAELSRNDH